MKHNNGKTLVKYDTPGRECAHADRGCCPKCEDPMTVAVRFESRKRLGAPEKVMS